PHRLRVVLDGPTNRIAWKSVLPRQRRHSAAFQAAEPAVGSNPERSVTTWLNGADTPLSEAIRGGIRLAQLAVGEMRNPTLEESNPQTLLERIYGQSVHP